MKHDTSYNGAITVKIPVATFYIVIPGHCIGSVMTLFNIADVRSSLGSEMSPIFSSDASSPATNSSGDSSPFIFESDTIPSPQHLEHNPLFLSIDHERSQNCRPVFENPRPAPLPPRQWRPTSLPQFRIPQLAPSSELTPPADDEGDVCDDAEDFLQFLTRSGFIAAERRTPSVHRDSFTSGTSRSGSRPTSMQGSIRSFRTTSMHSSRPTSGAVNSARPSSLLVNSRRTSLALRRGSSGIIPPILRNDTCTVPSVELIEPMSPPQPSAANESPPMRRESNLAKLMSHMHMSSDFTAASESVGPSSAVEDEPRVFLARRESSIDFSDLESLLGQARNPVLTQLHKAYTEQFEIMAHQIAALTREVKEIKRVQAEQLQFDSDTESSEDGRDLREWKSKSVPNGRESRLSTISVPQKSTSIDVCPAEAPFWKASLAHTGEEWDHGDVDGRRRGSMRCISPMTVC